MVTILNVRLGFLMPMLCLRCQGNPCKETTVIIHILVMKENKLFGQNVWNYNDKLLYYYFFVI